MKIFNKNSIVITTALAVAFTLGLAGPIIAFAPSPAPVDLLSAGNFAVLAGSGITDTNPSVVSGDVGLSPTSGTAIGIPSVEVAGTIYAVDGVGPIGSVNNPGLLTTAQNNLTTAYLYAQAQTPSTAIVGDLGGQVLAPGVYNSGSSIMLTGTVTLDGGGNPDAVFILQANSTLTTASSSHVDLINGAQACNVFWQVGSSATLGTTSDFKGNILAMDSITDNGGSTIEGRFLARNAAVTLDNTHITKATCVIPPPPPPPAPIVTSAGSCGTSDSAPLVNITEIPSPLALSSGPGSVTYLYTATNIGRFAMSNVWIADNSCSSVAFISGDDNNNSLLDVNESWVYSCTKTISQTTTSTATVHGSADCWDAYDTASATVVVGVPALPNTGMVPPLIHLVKTPNVFLLPVGGGPVTYMYAVTNPGTEPLSNVSVTDDKCTGLPGRVVGHPGDLNQNNLLESNETWVFICQTNLIQTTTNIGMAEGHANGLTAIDFSPVTVVVVSPALPNTGITPGQKNTPWNIAILAGVLVLVSTSVVVVLKKREI